MVLLIQRSGTYTSTGTTPAGCTATETLVLTINNSSTLHCL